MGIEVTVASTIERSPEAVFERIADVEAWSEWLIASGITAVRRSSSGPVSRGEHLVVEQVAAGRPGTFATEVTALAVPTRLVVQGQDDDGISIEIEASLAPTDAARAATDLHWTIRIGLPFRFRILEGIARPQANALSGSTSRRCVAVWSRPTWTDIRPSGIAASDHAATGRVRPSSSHRQARPKG